MTLEDFFTFTEMKDGFTAPARVQELVAVMKKENDSVLKNVGDLTRQWIAVASTIVATENKECLDLFVQLDGLLFINKWLKDAWTFVNEASTCFVEELILAMLLAVEKLQIDDERLVSSGIVFTVKGLLSYQSPIVQDKARALLDSWNCNNVGIKSIDVRIAADSDDIKKISQHPESQVIVNDDSLARMHVDQKSNGTEGENGSTNDQDSCHITFGDANNKDKLLDSAASPVKLDSDVNDPSVNKVVLFSSDRNSDSQILAAPEQGTIDAISEKCETVGEASNHDIQHGNLPNSVEKVEVSSSGASDGKILSGNGISSLEEADTLPDAGKCDGCGRVLVQTSSFDDLDGHVGVSTIEFGLEDAGKDDFKSLEEKGLHQGISSVLLETKDQGLTVSRLKEFGKDEETKRQPKSKNKHTGRSNKFVKMTKNSGNTGIIQQAANMDFGDGTSDPLEVTRLVAKDVEREVVNYDEQSASSSCSSAERNSIVSGGVQKSDSPASINGEDDMEINCSTNVLQTTKNVSPEASRDDPLNLEKDLQDMKSSQLTDAIREPEINAENCLMEFDLNQELVYEDLDPNQVDAMSDPISAISASRDLVDPATPMKPPKFEGSLGWKGSAATSAFRPASPRPFYDIDRPLSGGATSSISRRKQDFLDIDLNVAHCGDHKVVNHMSGKEKQMLPGLPSGESSVELSSKRSEKLRFDLNHTEENGNVQASEWKMNGLLFGPQKCRRSPSPGSSSSCIQAATTTRDFDLNDNPSSATDHSSGMKPFSWDSSSNTKGEESVISLFGTKLKKNTFPVQMPPPSQNGRALGPLMDPRVLRGGPFMGFEPSAPYLQSLYGHNGHVNALGPVVPFSPAPSYGPAGPIPSMFDTRGAPFVPQVVGAASTAPYSYCQPSVGMNMMGATPNANVAGLLHPNVVLSSGFPINAGNGDPTFYRQLFISGNSRLLDQMSDNFRPLGSGFETGSGSGSGSGLSGGKRREPDTGWELYPTNYKHHQPPRM